MHDKTKFIAGLAIAAFIAAAVPASAQATNEGKPAAPSPAKAAPLETGGKPAAAKGGAPKSAMKGKKKKHRR